MGADSRPTVAKIGPTGRMGGVRYPFIEADMDMTEKLFCDKCKEIQTHDYLRNPKGYDDDSFKFSSRGIRADYRTVKCQNCGKVTTYDFARD